MKSHKINQHAPLRRGFLKKYLSTIGKKSHPNGGTEEQKKASRENGKKGGRPVTNFKKIAEKYSDPQNQDG